jgi:hypothetical protein
MTPRTILTYYYPFRVFIGSVVGNSSLRSSFPTFNLLTFFHAYSPIAAVSMKHFELNRLPAVITSKLHWVVMNTKSNEKQDLKLISLDCNHIHETYFKNNTYFIDLKL